MDLIKQFIGGPIKQLAEKTGIHIFFISLLLYTHINWIKRHNQFGHIGIRFLLSFSIGMLLAFGIIKLIKWIAKRYNKNYEAFLDNLSIALSPGIFFILAPDKRIFLYIGMILCIVIVLYIWVKPFKSFIKSVILMNKFEAVLIGDNDKAFIDIKGTYEKSNPDAIQSFLIDMVINLNECSEIRIKEIKVGFSNLKGGGEEELKPMIESIAGYFNLRIIY